MLARIYYRSFDLYLYAEMSTVRIFSFCKDERTNFVEHKDTR